MRLHNICFFLLLLFTGKHTFFLLTQSLQSGMLLDYVFAILSMFAHCYILLDLGLRIMQPQYVENYLRVKRDKTSYRQLVETGFTPEEAQWVVSRQR